MQKGLTFESALLVLERIAITYLTQHGIISVDDGKNLEGKLIIAGNIIGLVIYYVLSHRQRQAVPVTVDTNVNTVTVPLVEKKSVFTLLPLLSLFAGLKDKILITKQPR